MDFVRLGPERLGYPSDRNISRPNRLTHMTAPPLTSRPSSERLGGSVASGGIATGFYVAVLARRPLARTSSTRDAEQPTRRSVTAVSTPKWRTVARPTVKHSPPET